MLTVAAFVLTSLLAAAACEFARGRFARVLATQDPRPEPVGRHLEAGLPSEGLTAQKASPA